MDRLRAVGIAVLVVGTALSGFAHPAASTPGALELAPGDFDRVQFRIAVHANGTARWTFHYERTLSNETEREQFEAFAAGFSESRLYTDFRNQSAALVALGREVTGREMDATGFSRRAFVATGLNEAGVVELSFSWTGFAAVEGSRVVVGDVFEGGLYLGPDQSLVVRAGPNLRFRSVAPEGTFSGGSPVESDTVTWQGERTFADNHPRVVFGRVPPGGATSTSGASPTTREPGTTDRPSRSPGGPSTPTNATAPPSGRSPGTILALGAALVVGIGAATLWWRRGGLARATGPRPDDDAAVSEEALMDDEARVEALLRENGGRMRQSAIVDGTGWSKSKVSMVLSEMEENGRVNKLRVGRENLVSLPGHEPDAARSPHDR